MNGIQICSIKLHKFNFQASTKFQDKKADKKKITDNILEILFYFFQERVICHHII